MKINPNANQNQQEIATLAEMASAYNRLEEWRSSFDTELGAAAERADAAYEVRRGYVTQARDAADRDDMASFDFYTKKAVRAYEEQKFCDGEFQGLLTLGRRMGVVG